jgi:hypothetical protein
MKAPVLTPELALPPELLIRASLRGNEYAWRIEDIPAVIEAARRASLVSLGGQLQFRLPDGGICECYAVEVNADDRSVDEDLPWDERVSRTADAALRDFELLKVRCDFLAEGWRDFPSYFAELVEAGRDPADYMCFVWYVTGRPDPQS